MLLDFFTIEDFKDSFPYAALGARVCYSSGDLESLLNDPRVVDKQKRAEFLSKLGNYKHFSVFSHSFVYKQVGRHTALNFSQRSQRYVKEDENYTIIPPAVLENETAMKLVNFYDRLSMATYNLLVYGYKIKREDARFFLPMGRRTTIVVSGTLNWINDFIEKRNKPHAQWEIRSVARGMRELIKL